MDSSRIASKLQQGGGRIPLGLAVCLSDAEFNGLLQEGVREEMNQQSDPKEDDV